MITFLIYLFLRKHMRLCGLKNALQTKQLVKGIVAILSIGLLILILSLIPALSKSQILQRNYEIMKGADNIGWLRLEKSMEGNRASFVLTSEVKTRIILFINVCTKETSVFENGQLIFSSISRKTNNNTKLNKQTVLVGNKYEVSENGTKENLQHSFIGNNLLSLYFREPKDIDQVYSDNHERFIKIIKTNDGGYKVKLPDGNSNCYYYKDGICKRIKIEHSFYSANIILSSKN